MTFEELQKVNATLKITDIKGKKYAEVNQRVRAFRQLFPGGRVITELLADENGECTFKAEIKDAEGNTLAVGHAKEKESSSFINKTSYIENCETSAVGRALGFLGIGIDTSIASAEEVQNAINNQTERSKVQIDALLMLAASKGVTAEQLCKKYKTKNLAELTEQQYLKAVDGLKGMPDV